jgi:hypothetical protein
MEKWKLVNGIVTDGGALDLDGINPWDFKWRSTGEAPITVSHPQYPDQKHKMNIYTIENGNKLVRFAAGEYSNMAWGFYLPVES